MEIGPFILAGAVLASAGAYSVGCWIWPYTHCPRCEGQGKHRAFWSSKAWRPCRRCKATGQRLRLGRRIYNWWHR
jgi:hypothetical protein